LKIVHTAIFCTKYETNGKFQAILKTASDWRAFFHKLYELEIYLGGDLGIKILGCE